MHILRIISGALLLAFGVLLAYLAIFNTLAAFVHIVLGIIATALFSAGLLILIRPRLFRRFLFYIIEYPLD